MRKNQAKERRRNQVLDVAEDDVGGRDREREAADETDDQHRQRDRRPHHAAHAWEHDQVDHEQHHEHRPERDELRCDRREGDELAGKRTFRISSE